MEIGMLNFCDVINCLCKGAWNWLYDLLEPSMTFLGYFETFWDLLGPLWTFLGIFGPFWTLQGHFWASLIPHLKSDYVIYEWYLIPKQLVDGNQTVLLLPIFRQNLTEPDRGDRPTSRRQKIRLRRHLPILKCNLLRWPENQKGNEHFREE